MGQRALASYSQERVSIFTYLSKFISFLPFFL